MRSKIKQILLSVTMLVPFVTVAHPGHGLSDGGSWTHYLFSPVHIGVGLILFLLVLSAVSYYKRRKIRRLSK